MREKVGNFISVFVGYSIIFLIRHNWDLSTKDIAEMIFIGVWLAVGSILLLKPGKRFVENVLKKMYPGNRDSH